MPRYKPQMVNGICIGLYQGMSYWKPPWFGCTILHHLCNVFLARLTPWQELLLVVRLAEEDLVLGVHCGVAKVQATGRAHEAEVCWQKKLARSFESNTLTQWPNNIKQRSSVSRLAWPVWPDWAILKGLFTNYLTIVAQISVEFVGYLKNVTIYVKTAVSTF